MKRYHTCVNKLCEMLLHLGEDPAPTVKVCCASFLCVSVQALLGGIYWMDFI